MRITINYTKRFSRTNQRSFVADIKKNSLRSVTPFIPITRPKRLVSQLKPFIFHDFAIKFVLFVFLVWFRPSITSTSAPHWQNSMPRHLTPHNLGRQTLRCCCTIPFQRYPPGRNVLYGGVEVPAHQTPFTQSRFRGPRRRALLYVKTATSAMTAHPTPIDDPSIPHRTPRGASSTMQQTELIQAGPALLIPQNLRNVGRVQGPWCW